MMSPLQLQMLLHYYAICEPYAMRHPEHAGSSAVQEQRHILVELELLEPASSKSGWKTTAKGNVYIAAICNLQLPIQKWIMP